MVVVVVFCRGSKGRRVDGREDREEGTELS